MLQDSLLWKIEGAALPAPSYLFGTMHVRDQRAFAKLPTVCEKIAACNAFAAEFNLGEPAGQADGSVMQLPDGQRISTLLSAKQWERCSRSLRKAVGLDLDQLDRMLPFAVVNLVAERLLQSERPEPLDLHLWEFAKQAGKALYGIETLAEQLAVLRQIGVEEQLKMLLSLCSGVGKYRHYLLRLADHYEAQRLRQLYGMVKHNSRGLRHLLLYRRNEVMAGRVAALAKEQQVFAAIGAAHLGGGKGVLRLLKNKGLRLSAVPM